MLRVTSNVLALHRPPLALTAVNLSEEMDAVIDFYQDKIRFKGIRVEKRYSPGVSIQAAPGEMRQIFSNLLINALEAVAERGKVIVHLFASPDWSGKQGIRAVVADNGPGIESARLRRVFDPLYTTYIQPRTARLRGLVCG